MNFESDQDQQWQKIQKVFLQTPKLSPSEHFVFRVMERIGRRETAGFSAFLRWCIPTLSLTFGSLLLISILYSPNERPIFETFSSKGGGPLIIEELSAFQAEANRDWTGLEVL